MNFIALKEAVQNHVTEDFYQQLLVEENKIKQLKYATSILQACDNLFSDELNNYIGQYILVDFYKVSAGLDKKGDNTWQDILRYDIKDKDNQKILRNSYKLYQLTSDYTSYENIRKNMNITTKMPLQYVISKSTKNDIVKDLLGEELYKLIELP